MGHFLCLTAFIASGIAPLLRQHLAMLPITFCFRQSIHVQRWAAHLPNRPKHVQGLCKIPHGAPLGIAFYLSRSYNPESLFYLTHRPV
jgi:hypothetical protein